MTAQSTLLKEVIQLFKDNPTLKDEVIVIGGVAVLLRLENAKSEEHHRETIDVDLILRPEVLEEKILAQVDSIKKDLFPIDSESGTAGPLEKETVDMILADNDLLEISGIVIPVVGPIGLLASKLSRSGVGKMESSRGTDLLDVILVWLADPEEVRKRVKGLKIPGVLEAVNELRRLLKDEFSSGWIAVCDELNLAPGDPQCLFLRANLDGIFRSLPSAKY